MNETLPEGFALAESSPRGWNVQSTYIQVNYSDGRIVFPWDGTSVTRDEWDYATHILAKLASDLGQRDSTHYYWYMYQIVKGLILAPKDPFQGVDFMDAL